MINLSEVIETNKMIQDENLDVRTITIGVSLLDCSHFVNRKGRFPAPIHSFKN